MKAKEFQIGDWVQWNFDVEPKHRQIFSIITEEDSDGNKEYYADLGDGEIYKDLIPIPLTPEILEKNGFDKYQQKESCPYYYIQGLSLRYHVHGEYFYIDTYAVDIRFKFVHELQHALRLCGLDELADSIII